MSENNSQAPVAQPAAPAPQENQPDFSKMTGEEAKAYVAAQKANKQSSSSNPIKEAAQEARDKLKPRPTEEPPKETQAEIKRKLKIDNEEIDEEEVLKVYKSRKDHQREANKRLQEGQAARKQAEEFISMMKDPGKLMEVIQKLGHDPRGLAEKYLVQQLEEEMLDPRDKELKDARAKLKQIEDMEKKQRDAVENQHKEAMKAKYAEDYTKQFTTALEKSNLPPTKSMVAEMAKYIARSAQLGFKMSADEAAQLVKEDVQQAHQRLIGDSDGEILIKLLGEEVANKIRKYDTSKLRNPEKSLSTPLNQSEPKKKVRNEGKRMTPAEWRKFNRGQ